MKIRVHPLFFAALLFGALFGGLISMLVCLLTALLHECGHIFCAAKMGFECEEIKVMPYGAAAVCDIEGISPASELRLALAGPLVNVFCCLALGGLWWFVPQAYAYTDIVMGANVAMLAVNLLPCYPLDGGRVLGCLYTKLFGKHASQIILRVSSFICSAALLAAFFVKWHNPSLITFSVFLVFSALEKPACARLVSYPTKNKLKRGLEVRYILCDKDMTFCQAFSFLDSASYLVLQLYDGGIADEITQDELFEKAYKCSPSDKVFTKNHFSRKDLQNISGDISPFATAQTQSTPNDIASSSSPSNKE